MTRLPRLVVGLAAALGGLLSCSDGGVVGGRCRLPGCELADAGPDALDDGGSPAEADAPSDAPYVNDALHPDADSSAADAGDAGTEAGAGPDAGADGGADAEGGSTCVPPFDTPAQCGSCTTQCGGSTPLCAPTDGGYACVSPCTPPLTACAGQCVDLATDPANCGSCGNACPSGLCQAGKCAGATAGHIVLLCMSFEQSQQGFPQTALLGNAVFLPPGNPVRILAYGEHASTLHQNKVKQALGWSAAAKGRTFSITPAGPASSLPALLSLQSFDVLLVYDQSNAPAGVLAGVGAAWKPALSAFVAAGGVVVVTSGGGGVGEMASFIESAGLLTTSGQTEVTGQVLFNNAPSDAVGLNVLSPFMAQNRTCRFTTTETPSNLLTFVVSEGGAAGPVVVHRVQ